MNNTSVELTVQLKMKTWCYRKQRRQKILIYEHKYTFYTRCRVFHEFDKRDEHGDCNIRLGDVLKINGNLYLCIQPI